MTILFETNTLFTVESKAIIKTPALKIVSVSRL